VCNSFFLVHGMQNSSSFFQGQARFSNGFFGIYHSPFGVELKGRNLKKNNAKNYRFGFQGQEGDDQIQGDGNSVNYSFRMHDPRLGRFFAVDPLCAKYPWNSSYAFSENKLIAYIELEGKESLTHIGPPEMNVILMIKSSAEIADKWCSANNQILGSYTILTVNSIQEGYQVLNSFVGSEKITNLIISSHGGFGTTTRANGSVDKWNYISIDEQDKTSPMTTSSDFPDDYSKEQSEQVDALQETMGLLREEGTLVITSCTAGWDDDLVTAISRLTKINITLYMNIDLTNLRPSAGGSIMYKNSNLVSSSVMDEDELVTKGVYYGWNMMKTGDKFPTMLKFITNKTGGLVVDPFRSPSVTVENKPNLIGPLQANGNF
jgi:RHS repeat-associated protein